jgi:hypothetical protein
MTVLETDRLLLRKFSVADAEFILELLNQPSFLRFIGDKGVRTLADARDYILQGPVASYERHGFGLYLTVLKEGALPIGMCGLLKRESLADVDIGFAFLPRFWAKGYALESALALELAHHYVHPIEVDRNVGLLAAVGEGMQGKPGLAGRIFTAISRVQVNIIAIAQGSSELTIAVVVRRDGLEQAVKSVHAECGLGRA